jgi:hypothetical protein
VPSALPDRGRSSGVEHNLAKVGVVGSNPIARSNFARWYVKGFNDLPVIPGDWLSGLARKCPTFRATPLSVHARFAHPPWLHVALRPPSSPLNEPDATAEVLRDCAPEAMI